MMPMDLPRIPTLHAAEVCYIAYHTVGAPNGEDASAAEVNRYHRKELGWAAIGYHFVIRKDGSVETGRPLTKKGAHLKGLNDCAIGIAFSGNGDLYPLTRAQMESGVDLGVRLARLYDVSIESIIGHREVNVLVDLGRVESKYLTTKSCPGVRVSMWKIRHEIAVRLFPPPQPLVLDVPEIELDEAA